MPCFCRYLSYQDVHTFTCVLEGWYRANVVTNKRDTRAPVDQKRTSTASREGTPRAVPPITPRRLSTASLDASLSNSQAECYEVG
jgi:hypothetical protein